MEAGDRKDSEVALHIYGEVFTYSARNNWILEETRDPGSKGPEPSSHETLYAAINQQQGEVHNFPICMQTEQLTLVNCDILNICKTRCTAIPEGLKLLINIPFCPWKKVKAYFHLTANEYKTWGAWGKQTLRSADLASDHYKTQCQNFPEMHVQKHLKSTLNYQKASFSSEGRWKIKAW